MATEKQLKWRIRNRVLWEIKGIASKSNIADSMCLTQKERELLRDAFDTIQDVVDNFTESSRELGFNAVERCRYCGKPATHEGLCEKCYNMRNH
jgi:hypothetical protein